MTGIQHLCAGVWRDGTAKTCSTCQPKQKPRPVKRDGES